MNSTLPTLRGERVALRALARADLEVLRGFVNDPEVMRFSNVFHPVSDAQQEQWFEGITRAGDAVWFGVERYEEKDRKLIGTCCLVGVDWISRLAEFRIRLGDKSAWGCGLGTEASRLLVRYGFMDLNLERIWLRVFASNARAVHMYTKLGFQVEGRLRRAAFIQGAFDDVILMGLLRTEWDGLLPVE